MEAQAAAIHRADDKQLGQLAGLNDILLGASDREPPQPILLFPVLDDCLGGATGPADRDRK